MEKIINKIKVLHFWHIVNISPWPILLSFNIFSLPLGLVIFFQGYYFGLVIFLMAFVGLFFTVNYWFRDMYREAIFEGFHTKQVKTNLKIGMFWFIFSEVMFFFAFFWSFFWSSITPTIVLNMSWPPVGLADLVFNPIGIPLVNTIILLLSGVSITIAHLYIQKGDLEKMVLFTGITLVLAWFFIAFQAFEYASASFNISDGIYGSTFFLCTGFHGFHVFIGSIFIGVVLLIMMDANLSRDHHVSFEAAAWYWHFVDVVWLFLYTMIYYWGYDMVSSGILYSPGVFKVAKFI